MKKIKCLIVAMILILALPMALFGAGSGCIETTSGDECFGVCYTWDDNYEITGVILYDC